MRQLEVIREDVRFMLPKAIRVEQHAREAARV